MSSEDIQDRGKDDGRDDGRDGGRGFRRGGGGGGKPFFSQKGLPVLYSEYFAGLQKS